MVQVLPLDEVVAIAKEFGQPTNVAYDIEQDGVLIEYEKFWVLFDPTPIGTAAHWQDWVRAELKAEAAKHADS